MAPNLVKSSSTLSLDLSSHLNLDLSSHLNFSLDQPRSAAVYPPLTDVDVLTYEGDQHNDSVFSTPMKRSNSVIFNIMVKDEAQRAVSCAQIEANLIADSNRIQEESNQEYIENDGQHQEVESYWDMPSDCDNVQEEVKVVSTAQIERNLVEDALRQADEAKKSKEVVVNNHVNNAYWDWPSEPVLESEKKAALIASIILEESIRERLSIDSITNNEVSNKVQDNSRSSTPSAVASEDASADYWYWNAEETKEEVVAPHVHDLTHPNHAYWDFPSEPTSAADLRQKIIDNILKEERIRQILSTEATEEREANYHQQKVQGKKVYNRAAKSELESVPEHYWDFNASSENNVSLLSKDKQALINRILREEQLRYILSTENIESHLVASMKQSDRVQRSNIESATVSAASYWDW